MPEWVSHISAEVAVALVVVVLLVIVAVEAVAIWRLWVVTTSNPHERIDTDWFAWFLGVGFFATVWIAMFHGIPEGGSHDVVLMLVTAVVTYTGAMVSFRYGTTSTSHQKDTTIRSLAGSTAVAASTAASVQTANVVAAAERAGAEAGAAAAASVAGPGDTAGGAGGPGS